MSGVSLRPGGGPVDMQVRPGTNDGSPSRSYSPRVSLSPGGALFGFGGGASGGGVRSSEENTGMAHTSFDSHHRTHGTTPSSSVSANNTASNPVIHADAGSVPGAGGASSHRYAAHRNAVGLPEGLRNEGGDVGVAASKRGGRSGNWTNQTSDERTFGVTSGRKAQGSGARGRVREVSSDVDAKRSSAAREPLTALSWRSSESELDPDVEQNSASSGIADIANSVLSGIYPRDVLQAIRMEILAKDSRLPSGVVSLPLHVQRALEVIDDMLRARAEALAASTGATACPSGSNPPNNESVAGSGELPGIGRPSDPAPSPESTDIAAEMRLTFVDQQSPRRTVEPVEHERPLRHNASSSRDTRLDRHGPHLRESPARNLAVKSSENQTVEEDGGRLHKSANPWQIMPGMQSETESRLRTIQGILNKITPETFSKLSKEVLVHMRKIKNADEYNRAVSQVFDTAVVEPKFSKLYADLSKILSAADARNTTLPDDATFRRLLLNACHDEFEKLPVVPRTSGATVATDDDERALKQWSRQVGNVQFIGELFLRQLLSGAIVEAVVDEFIQNVEAAVRDRTSDTAQLLAARSCELLVRLLTISGRSLDEDPTKRPIVDGWFARLSLLKDRKDIFPPRVRFCLLELVELRNKLHWIPRASQRERDSGPKLLSEVQEEVHRRALLAEVDPSLAATAGGAAVAADTLTAERLRGLKVRPLTAARDIWSAAADFQNFLPAADLEHCEKLAANFFRRGDTKLAYAEISKFLSEHSDSELLRISAAVAVVSAAANAALERDQEAWEEFVELVRSLLTPPNFRQTGALMLPRVVLVALRPMVTVLPELRLDVPHVDEVFLRWQRGIGPLVPDLQLVP